ncbi:MAG: hypothetical protein KDE27_03695 [Planctomycetes bacterium]|nr:hypothetical protein [Planctomycetota bacterium]
MPETTRILVLGKTYPSYSQSYDELSCTGGLHADTLAMVRLHPINFRDLPAPQRFSDWHWIEADIAKDDRDPRPESYRVAPGSIRVHQIVTKAEERRNWLERTPHYFGSLEELKARQAKDGTSLGVIRPARLTGNRVVPRPPSERAAWQAKEKVLFSQLRMFGQPRRIDFPDLEFKVGWECADTDCPGHEMSFHNWGLHELSRKLVDDEQRREKVRAKMDQLLDERERDVYLMLGNFRGHMTTFGLMGALSVKRGKQPKAQGQGSLFE